MSESDSSSEKQKNISKQKSQKVLQKQKLASQQPQKNRQPAEDQVNLYDQNKKLRRKLKQLSMRLDQELQKAAEYKLKHMNQRNGHPVSLQSQNLQLQNAYKMIQRLQKAVRDFESKQSYQITLKRVMDLQSIIKKKQSESQVLKTQIKTQKKIIKQKQKYIEELIQNGKKMNNPAQDLQTINKLKAKMKKIMQENDLLRKKQLQKHQKLVKAERRIVELQQDNQNPIGRQQSLLKQIQDLKAKYKQTIQRIQRQNIYISKLNQKLNKQSIQKLKRTEKRSQSNAERKSISKSMEQLPDLKHKINTSNLLEHLPSPKIGVKLKRY